jgi:hypothetical protein
MSYQHLNGCTIGDHQGIYTGLNMSVPKAISIVKAKFGIFKQYTTQHGSLLSSLPATYQRVFNSDIVTIVLLADFLYHKIDFPKGKARRVRAIKNKLKGIRLRPRANANTKWYVARLSHIEDMLELLKYPLKMSSAHKTLGPFTLKNPIHLSDEKVLKLEAACKEALSLCTNSLAPGFTSCLYGDVTLTEKIGRSSWLAWYHTSKDDITIKYFEHEKHTFMRTFIHELGHRYYRKILPADKKGLWSTYHILATTTRVDLRDWIKDPSTVFYVGVGRTRQQVSTTPEHGLTRALIQSVDYKGVYFVTGSGEVFGPFPEKWVKSAIRAKSGNLPSQYASTSAEEHFCEALAYKAVGELNEQALDSFNSIIIDGVASTPAKSMVSEVAPAPVAPTPVAPTPVRDPKKIDLLRTDHQHRACVELAERLGLSYKGGGSKYGIFSYENVGTSTKHAYMFLDRSTNNLFVPKSATSPNTKVNLGNLSDSDIDDKVSFKRMDKLRPKWRTQAKIKGV